MEKVYNQEFLENILETIERNIEELERWSVRNYNEKLDEIALWHTDFHQLKKLLIKEK